MSSSFSRGRISPKCAARSGSALLIVLGMLSFMVISGVAFSVFMRSSRLTSSFTRRASSTRQLAKAALAEAIDQIDRSIGNDPHPNVQRNGFDDHYNHWLGRVLLTPYRYVKDNGDEDTRWADWVENQIDSELAGGNSSFNSSSVSVLTAEALAYVPPPLVNEVRYFGRKTPTACWQTFDFDAGRYAYVAVDVSDYFDVNRVLANEARSSNPARRVNIAHIFEGGNGDHSSAPSNLDDWENFMKEYLGRNPQDDGAIDFDGIPFTSLADFNILLGSQEPCGFKSPFYEAFKSGGKGCDQFYQCTPGNGDWDTYTSQTFVTDSLSAPETQTGASHFDLDDEDGQPFDEAYFNQNFKNRSFSYLADKQKVNASREELARNRLSLAGLIALADYLDYDDVPTSLAVPTTERVPMVCGVQPIVDGLKVVVTYTLSEPVDHPTANPPYTDRKVEVRYKLDGPVNVDAWTAFPFRDRAGYSDGYKASCRVALFLSQDEMGLRTRTPGGTDVLRAPTWNESAGLSDGIANLFVSDLACSTKAISDPKDAVSSAIGFNLGEASAAFSGDNAGGCLLFEMTYKWDMVKDSSGNWVRDTAPTTSKCTVSDFTSGSFAPVCDDGSLATVPKIAIGTQLNAIDLKPYTVRFNLATWVTVRNDAGDAVDLVPACMADDRAVNSVINDDTYNEFFQRVAGLRAPLLKFAEAKEDAAFAMLDANKLLDGSSIEHTITLAHPNGIVVRDPRYNHAPENWFAAGSKITPQYWCDNCGCTGDGRDGDIFMATSDQGYLQSISELAFLPRFTDLNKVPSQQDYGDRIVDPETWKGLDYPEKGYEAQANMMWRTYNPFDRKYNADNVDGFADLQEIFHHHGKGVRVNPYSDSTNIVLAALANTPISWRVASDNETANPAAGTQTKADSFNKKYAWNAYNSNNEISWEDLSGIAGRFMNEVREAARDGDTWETALQDVFCDDRATDGDVGGSGSLGNPEEHLCGIDLEKDGKFYSTDKKTLWGFWQDSFAANQQLFLVFFRAEPMMMGGGISDATPPQLGARGVALVWRNPNVVKGSVGAKGYADNQADPFDQNPENDLPQASAYTPHQTRVLFYRQFE